MEIDVQKKDKGQVELTIELTADEYQPFLVEAAKKISEDVKISGFRPGKADLETVKQRAGEDRVWREALEPAVKKTFVQALDREKLVTVGSPKIDVIKLAPGNPVVYKATVSLLPDAELGDYSKITIAKNQAEIKDEEINKVLSDLQKSRAKETLMDKKAEKGDKVEIDFETFLDKIPVDHGKNVKFPLVIGEGTFIPGFEDQLIGMAKDEKKEFKLEFPKNYHQKNLAGRMVDFKVKVNAVYKIDLPDLNNDFAKGLGNFKTLEDLKNQIKNNLKTEAEKKEDRRLEEEIIGKIVEQGKFGDMPDLLV
ncbi:MAG: trigger factor, partial [Patescibacteria group bacterium]|nr:trigger factor [Patescibacteria group bacterium]